MSLFQANTAKFCMIGTTVEVENYSRIEGDVGATTGITVDGTSLIASPGVQHSVNDTDTQNAITNINAVYADLISRSFDVDITGETLGGTIPSITPGVYRATNANVFFRGSGGPATFTFDAPSISDKFIIQVLAGGSSPGNVLFDDDITISFLNFARPENVYLVCEGDIEIRNVPSCSMSMISQGNIIGHPSGSIFAYSRMFAPTGTVSFWYSTLGLPSAFCYAKGTLIRTVFGYVPIEELKEGDEILTYGKLRKCEEQPHSAQFKKVKFVGKMWVQVFSPVTMPVTFKKGSLGPNMPFEDLTVSPNHAIVKDGKTVAAHHFVNGETVVRHECTEMDYYVVQSDDHYVIDANGVRSETLNGNHKTFEPVNPVTVKNDTRVSLLCN